MKVKDIFTENWADDVRAMTQPELDKASEQEQLAAIKKNATAIYNISAPTREMQELAIRAKPTIIASPIHFDEDMIMLAISLNGFVIAGVKNPTEEMQLIAVRNHPGTLSSIKNPTKLTIRTALTDERNFIHDQIYGAYQHEVKQLFANNALLMKKWLRYGEVMYNENK